MAGLQYGFYNAEFKNGEYDRTYDATDFSLLFGSFISEGVIKNGSSSFAVVKNGNNGVTVMPGMAWIQGTWNRLDDLLKLTIPTTSALYGIILEVDKTNRTNRIFVKDCGNAQKVYLTNTSTSVEQVYQRCLAAVFVANGSITKVESCIGQGEAYCVSPTPWATSRLSGGSASGSTSIDASAYTTAIKFKGTSAFDLTFKTENGLTYTNSFTVTESNGKITKITNSTVGRSIAISYG